MKALESLPRPSESLPLVPLRDMVVFPHMMSPFVVGRDSSIRALEAALATPSKRLFLAAQKNPQLDDPAPGDIYAVGVVATVAQSLKLPNGHFKLMVEGVRRGRIQAFEEGTDYMAVTVEPMLQRDVETQVAITLNERHGHGRRLVCGVIENLDLQLGARVAQTRHGLHQPLEDVALVVDGQLHGHTRVLR